MIDFHNGTRVQICFFAFFVEKKIENSLCSIYIIYIIFLSVVYI